MCVNDADTVLLERIKVEAFILTKAFLCQNCYKQTANCQSSP